jgi:Na+-translocating ferredoxin:NAD+ oxidoreductase RnfC subunit
MTEISLNTIYERGIVGAGGAGFPSHIKFRAEAEIVIMNGAECEPLLHKDKQLLKTWPQECLNGLREVMKLVGAKRGIVAVKEKYDYVFKALEPFMTSPLEFCRLGNFYPAGDEITLVYETVGRVVAPGQIPLSTGCIVSNVETLFNIQKGKPVTTSFLSVVGEVRNPVSLEVLIGSPCEEAISAAGGVTCEDPVLLLGGPMMGQFTEDLSTPITKTTGGILVLDRSHDLIRLYLRSRQEYEKIAKASCDQCNFCTELCPRYLLGHPIEPHKNMRNTGFATSRQDLIAGAEFCCECNLCSLYACPEDLDPKNISTDLKWVIKNKTEGRLNFDPGSVKAHPMMDFRKAPIPKLMRKLDLDRFTNKAPLKSGLVGSLVVQIPLSQHIGAPAKALVSEGETVEKGQIIARPQEGDLGACIHASISGKVLSVGNRIQIRG